jgi:hypothetical protein
MGVKNLAGGTKETKADYQRSTAKTSLAMVNNASCSGRPANRERYSAQAQPGSDGSMSLLSLVSSTWDQCTLTPTPPPAQRRRSTAMIIAEMVELMNDSDDSMGGHSAQYHQSPRS